MEFSGRLASFPPEQLLQWAETERRTGSLVVRRSRRQKRVFFVDGKVVACLSDDPAEYYGQYLLLYGYVTESELIQALSHCAQSGKRLGGALIDLGILSEGDVRDTLSHQIQDMVCGLFLWQHGVFYFEDERPPTSEVLPPPIRTMHLVLEGSRWKDEMARFRSLFPHDHVVMRRGRKWDREELSPLERRVTGEVDGERTLKQIYSLVRGPYFRVLEAINDLCLREVLDVGEVGDAGDTGTVEISVFDLLLEQAMEEQMREEPAIPLDVLGRFYPIWVRQPTSDEAAQLAQELPKLWQRLDGTTPLRELLAQDEEDRARKLDLLMLHLRNGKLALLPDKPAVLAVDGNPEVIQQGWWQKLFGG